MRSYTHLKQHEFKIPHLLLQDYNDSCHIKHYINDNKVNQDYFTSVLVNDSLDTFVCYCFYILMFDPNLEAWREVYTGPSFNKQTNLLEGQ